MFYETELRFIRETFRKCRVNTGIYDPTADIETLLPNLPAFLSGKMQKLMPEILPNTVYRIRDSFDSRYIFLLLPDAPTDAVLVIGPYLTEVPAREKFLELAEYLGISPSRQTHLLNYISSLPLLPDNSQLYMLLDVFYERLWGSNGFTVEYLDRDSYRELVLKNNPDQESDNTLLNMKNMELRYNYENELMHAVAKGQLHKAESLFGGTTTFLFEQRVADPVRNAKNYCIIMNTLLRKAAEQGGVHPIFLDSASSTFAQEIEQAVSLEQIPPLMTEMFRAYCRLVRNHSTRDYSPPIQQALLYIEANLASDLNLRTLADMLNISSSYLSTIFKKETGATITDFIARRRVERAKDLLRTTRLQVQTIAQHCGILDVHYFSKIFKKISGMTPKEYRDSLKQ